MSAQIIGRITLACRRCHTRDAKRNQLCAPCYEAVTGRLPPFPPLGELLQAYHRELARLLFPWRRR